MLNELEAWKECQKILKESKVDGNYYIHVMFGGYKGLCHIIKQLSRCDFIDYQTRDKMLAKIDLGLNKESIKPVRESSYPYLYFFGEEGKNQRIKFCQERINRMHKR